MIKKCLLAFMMTGFLLGNAVIVHAQKIYLFSEGLYNDTKIGTAIQKDTEECRFVFTFNVPRYQLVVYNGSNSEWSGPVIRQSNDTRNDILRAIRNCPAGPSDTIVFYWFGHGAFDEGGHWLQMPANRGDFAMYRSEIRDALQAKNARLTVLWTFSCHVFVRFQGGSSLAFKWDMPTSVSPIFQSLFLDCKGLVDFNASSPGEEAWCSTTYGGFYTNEIIKYLDSNRNVRTNWKSVLDAAQRNLRNNTDYNPKNRLFHYYAWSLGNGGSNGGGGGGGIYHPENGDRIVAVNGISIENEAHFRQVIRDAGTHVTLTIVDHRKGGSYQLSTNLNPRGSVTRLGIYVQDDYRGGVVVTGVMPGSPGNQCRLEGGGGNGGGSINGQWSAPVYHPENGDRILFVNGEEIQNETHFRRIIRDADTRITLTLIDHRTGNRYVLMTDLLPQGSTTRLGIYVENDYNGGVRVTGVMAGTPGTKCRYLQNANVPTVRSNDNVYW